MPKAYFIGGTPRVGKTTLAITAIKKQPMLSASTDALRNVLRSVMSESEAPGLFTLKTDGLSADEIVERTTDIEKSIRSQYDESLAVWRSVIPFVTQNLDDGFDVLIEGMAVLPEFISRLKLSNSAIFIGNSSDEHIKTTLTSAANNPHDWLGRQDGRVAEAFCTFNQSFSRHIEAECERYKCRYIEISDDDFEGSIEKALGFLLN